MRLTGHTSRTIFDRDPIIHEQERLKAEDELVASLARQARRPAGARTGRTNRASASMTRAPTIGAANPTRPDSAGRTRRANRATA